jgi:hypothetical protein
MTEAPARVRGTCLTVVTTAKMTAIAKVTDSAAKVKRGSITSDLSISVNVPLSAWFRALLGEIGAVKNVLPPFVNFHDGGSRRCDEG